jgi:hypothetical protein
MPPQGGTLIQQDCCEPWVGVDTESASDAVVSVRYLAGFRLSLAAQLGEGSPNPQSQSRKVEKGAALDGDSAALHPRQ